MEDHKMTTLLYTAKNESDLLLKTSILESENIAFLLKNYNSQDLFGIGKIGTGFSLVVGNPEIWVSEDDYNHALELISIEYETVEKTEPEENFEVRQQNFFDNQFMQLFKKILILIGIVILFFFIKKHF